MAFHKKCRLTVEDMVKSHWIYRKLRNFRAGIEANISCLKRAFGPGRCTWRGLAHFRPMSGRRSSPTTWRYWPGSLASDPTQRHRPRRCCSRRASTRPPQMKNAKMPAIFSRTVVTNDLLRPNCGHAPALPPDQARKNPVYGRTLAKLGHPLPLADFLRNAHLGWVPCEGPRASAIG